MSSVPTAPLSCANPTCGKSPATQRCPTCRDLGVPESLCHFCSKECFQGTWEEHKKVHRHFKELALSTLMSSCPWRSRFEGYRFTGPLRAFLVTPQVRVPEGLACPDYSGDGRPRSELLERGKQFNIAEWTRAEDLRNLRRAGAIAREVTDIAAGMVRPGVTGDEIDKAVFAACVERGAYPSPLNYRGFPKSVCISVNEVICHGIPDTRPLQDGDIVNLDVTVYYKGFHADMNETYTVGVVDAAGRKLVKCAYDCLAAAMALCKPGVFYRDLGAAISRIAESQGFSVVRNYTGHGVGALFHTSPNIPHYKGNRAQGVMKVGHVFTIEPVRNCAQYLEGIFIPPPLFFITTY
jgi:methionyl aminopeptidase